MIDFDLADQFGREVSEIDTDILDVPLLDGILGQKLRGRVRLWTRFNGSEVEKHIRPVKELIQGSPNGMATPSGGV